MIDNKNQEDLDRDREDAERAQGLLIVAQLQGENDAALQALAREGVQVHHDSLTSARLAILLDFVLGTLDDEKSPRLAYELTCQQKFKEMIENVQTQVRMQKLTAGVNGAIPQNGNGFIH